jgi:ferritin-like metal-binding protein YciE
MKNSCNDNICDWLRDAHAMEEQSEKLFSRQADRLISFTGLRAKLGREVKYIMENQALLSTRLEQLGCSSSVIKDIAGKVVAGAQNILGMSMSDEPVKGILALHTFTQIAIGSYKILITAAQAINDAETSRICNIILLQTEGRAAWIEKQLAEVTKTYLLNDVA